MKFAGLLPLPLLACLSTGCSTRILEETNEISIARDCREPMKLFNSFVMRTKNISWSEAKEAKEKVSILTIDLTLETTTKWPIAPSNSGNGVLYSIEYSLTGEDGARHAPKERTGIAEEIHRPVKADEQAEGKLLFRVPRANYVFAIERKFSGNPVVAKREDQLSVCKISARDVPLGRPSSPAGMPGVY
jgi:hypothetical protein